ncbi:sulfatase-like hydrolase/transferase [Pelagicoccus sp. SDUM812005]|uniref:sulfatase-like hydrolase/transferase n=1 Tax=Pelagicoccus sp. SDUM812005 TaxID=3041257 RepID=UPI00280FD3B8|nr:sulfatase-like hydrolase/transferase [Pelagicoccus sp. SDUM812005]MDQ8183133.1 sulfatase-like hydrolase/transferase [Pelagicoccus sp. SDUM812005]
MKSLRHLTLALACIISLAATASAKDTRPNIIWVMGEDMGPELSCYGHPAIHTPHFDALAEQGTRFTQAFGTASSCTPNRNAMMTGLYQTRVDLQDQRRRGIKLPHPVRPITHILQEAGYYTAIGCGYSQKTDLNFEVDNLFDGRDWSGRAEGQPFFAQITLYESHRLVDGWKKITETAERPVDRDAVEFPPYFPDHPVVREDWARYLESIQYIDNSFGEIMKRLHQEGIADKTIVIFIGDNGQCHLRGKCWLYDAGIHVPFIVRDPTGKFGVGEVNHDLVSTIDISATILDWAGIEVPDYFDGRSLIAEDYTPREYVFSATDLLDSVMDRIRSVRTDRYKYIRNYTPENGYLDSIYVQENRPMYPVIQDLYQQGKLNAAQSAFLAETKPLEELYDLQNDPYELNNLADSTAHASLKKSLSKQLDAWLEDTADKGLAEQRRIEKLATGTTADPATYLAEFQDEFEKRWPKNRRITIAAHGHSVPTGYTTRGVVKPYDAYPHLLEQALKERYPHAVINVIPTGIGGENSILGGRRFESDVLALKPDIITIDYSLNDRHLGLRNAREAWERMIEKALLADVKVLLLTPTGDWKADMQSPDDPLTQHAAQVRELAEEYGVGLVDSYQSFLDHLEEHGTIKPIMAQSNHPNRLGHQLVLKELAKWFPGIAPAP